MKNNIAIIFFGDCFYDARCTNMMLSLSTNNHVTMICVFNSKLKNSLYDNVNFIQIKIKKSGFGKYVEFYKKTLSAIKKHSYTHIIAGDLYSLASAASKKNHSKIIYDCREIYSNLFAHINKPIYRLICRVVEKYYLNFVDTVIVTAKTDLKFLKKTYNKYQHLHWETIFNYPLSLSIKKTKNLRLLYNIPKNNSIVLYQGAIHRGRGITQLIQLASLCPKITAVIIGSGVEKNNYIYYAKSLNVLSRVHFLGKVPYVELLQYSAECDVGWCVISNRSTSYNFALPNKLFEYLLADLPVLATPLPNIKKLYHENNLGRLTGYNNTQQHKEHINYIVKNIKKISFYKKIAEKKFVWGIQNEKFLNIFD